MQIADRTKERSTVILVVTALLVIGVTLVLSMWQSFRHQREAEEQHLFLTSRAVFMSIESSVRRGPVREGENRLSPRTADFFQALEQDGDVLFVGIIDERGGRLLASPLHGDTPIELPRSVVEPMLATGEWHGRKSFGNFNAYIYGERLKPLRGMPASLRDELGPPGFLVVGIDMEKYLSVYAGFRKNIVFQTLYILAVAVCTLALGISFLSRREQAMKAKELELFQAKLIDNLPDGLITLRTDGTVHSANPAALSILGGAAPDLLGRSASALPGGLGRWAEEGASRPASGSWQHIEYRGAHLEVLALPIADDAENAWLLIIRDRTALRTLEKSLADAEKLAAIGTLAAGVAHEVRNPLSSLRGFAQYFVKKLAGRAPEEEYAKTMVREADRLNRVITDLLFLGRPKTITPRPIALEPFINGILTLLRFDLEQRGVGVALRLNTPAVTADEDSLKQTLLNLLLNSLDALNQQQEQGSPPEQLSLFDAAAPSAGEQPTLAEPSSLDDPDGAPLTHERSAESSAPGLPDPTDPAPLRIISGQNDEGVWIEVQDTGCGMTEEQQAQAFEPFFTEKAHGTGLGLALVRRTMMDHGGKVLTASAHGKGCTIRLLFPHYEQTPENLPPPSAQGMRETDNAGGAV